MNVDIVDFDTFNSIPNETVVNYLLAKGWEKISHALEGVGIWDKIDSDGNVSRIWVPLDEKFADYAEVMAQCFGKLSVFEGRSQLQILEDFQTIGIGDVIRFRTEDSLSRNSGTLVLQDGIDLLQKAYDVTVAAAQSAIVKRPVYARPFNKVADYMQRVRLGQTERGSYLVKVISPLEITKSMPRQLSLEIVEPEPERPPFEREVVIALVESLVALREVVESVDRRGIFNFHPFEEAVAQGISANLCEAIAFRANQVHTEFLEVNVNWSYLWEPPATQETNVIFPRRVMPYLIEAARNFRQRFPEEILLQGYVTTLRREKIGDPSSVTIVGMIDRAMRTARVLLDAESYETAIIAHKNEYKVSVFGILRRQGNFHILENAQNFHVLDSNFQ